MKQFLPAAHYHFLTPLYDFFVRTTFKKVFQKISDIVNPKAGSRILDLGCGPGNLIIALKKKQPKTTIVGLDIDPAILKIAHSKFRKEKLDVPTIEAGVTEIPVAGDHFDVVVSSLMFHHLTSADKKRAAQEVHRVLKKGGVFYLYDFGHPQSTTARLAARFYNLFEDLDDAIHNRYKVFLQEAGFKDIKTVHHSMLFELIEARKP